MNNTCKAEFVDGSSYPIRITIHANCKSLFLNITRSASCRLENFLRDKHSTIVDCNTKSGRVSFRRVNDVAGIEVSLKGFTVYLDSYLAYDLANRISAIKYTKHTYPPVPPEEMPQSPVDQRPITDSLAGANERTDDNLRKFFGYD